MAFTLNLRQRFSLIILCSIALASLVMIATLYWAVSNYTRNYTLHYWQEYTQTFAKSAKFSVTLASADKAKEITRHFKKQSVIEKAAIYARSGQLLASTGTSTRCLELPRQNDTAWQRFAQAMTVELADVWCFYGPVYYMPTTSVFDTANSEHALIGRVELIVSKQAWKKVIQKILWLSIVCVIVFEMVIFITVQHFADVLTRALLEIANVMTQIRQGKRGLRTTFSGPAELIALKRGLNDMLDQLETQEGLLEQQVALRTSELQTALNSALSASRYKSKIISMVSHEMKSPLHGLMGYTQLALETLQQTPAPDAEDSLHKGMTCARNLERQINQVLDYARLESSQAKVSRTRFSLRQLIKQCVEKIEPLIEERGNQIQYSDEDLELHTDQDKLMHILVNLIDNANKFTRDGHINVGWSHQGDRLSIVLADTGCGIAAADLDKIFEPFWQADMSLSRPAGGTGLGLAICRLYSELLGGELGVESSDRGSVFTLCLPIAAM